MIGEYAGPSTEEEREKRRKEAAFVREMGSLHRRCEWGRGASQEAHYLPDRGLLLRPRSSRSAS
jgi:hypothetical protein